MADENRIIFFRKGYSQVDDTTFIFIIKDLIRQSIRSHCITFEIEAIEVAVDVIYPVAFNIVFNSNFSIRHDEPAIESLINYLVTHLDYKLTFANILA